MADGAPKPVAPRRSAGHAATAAVSIAAAFALTASGGAAPSAAAPRPDVPSWQEVQAAKQSEAAKRAEIAKIEGLLGTLRARADELAKVAMLRGEDALLARGELVAAEATTERLAHQLADAGKRADASSRLASSLIARLARSGGDEAGLTLAFASETEADRLLSRLGTMSKLSESSAALVQQAVFDRRAVSALEEQAQRAEAERRERADAAERAGREAAQAAAEVEAQAAEQAASQSVLYAQLASLKGTTAELERQYAEGVAAQQPTEPGGGGTGGGGTGGTPVTPPPTTPTIPTIPPPTTTPEPPTAPPPTPVGSVVDRAIAYAKAQLGEPYLLGGMGPDAWDCSGLVKASYASAGVYVGTHSSTDQYNYMAAQGRLVPYAQAQPGDLIFYSDGGSASLPRKYHVAIYLGGGKMIEAPNPSAPVRIVNVRPSDLVPYVGRPTG